MSNLRHSHDDGPREDANQQADEAPKKRPRRAPSNSLEEKARKVREAIERDKRLVGKLEEIYRKQEELKEQEDVYHGMAGHLSGDVQEAMKEIIRDLLVLNGVTPESWDTYDRTAPVCHTRIDGKVYVVVKANGDEPNDLDTMLRNATVVILDPIEL